MTGTPLCYRLLSDTQEISQLIRPIHYPRVFPFSHKELAAVLMTGILAISLYLTPHAHAAQSASAAAPPATPILFVTQVPVPADFTTIAAVFGNHKANMQADGDARTQNICGNGD